MADEAAKQAADDQLRAAIIAHADAYSISSEGEMLSEYGVVSCWMPPERNGQTTYGLHFHLPEVPTHVAIGLFTMASRLVGNDGNDEGDEG